MSKKPIYRVRPGILLLSVTLLIGCVSPRQVNKELPKMPTQSHLIDQMAEIQQPNYRVRAGDHIKIEVWDYPQFNVDTDIPVRGSIVIPLVGEINVAGLTKSEITSKLRSALKEYISGDINMTVTISGIQKSTVFILGSVRRPDTYNMTDTLTIFQALSVAGGVDPTADLRNIRIYRPSAKHHVIQLDVIQYLKNGQIDPNAIVYPGDIIFVPPAQNVVDQMTRFLSDAVILIGLFRVFN